MAALRSLESFDAISNAEYSLLQLVPISYSQLGVGFLGIVSVSSDLPINISLYVEFIKCNDKGLESAVCIRQQLNHGLHTSTL